MPNAFGPIVRCGALHHRRVDRKPENPPGMTYLQGAPQPTFMVESPSRKPGMMHGIVWNGSSIPKVSSVPKAVADGIGKETLQIRRIRVTIDKAVRSGRSWKKQ